LETASVTDNKYNMFVGKPERKRLVEKSRRRWDDNIKTDLRGKKRCDSVDRIHLALDRDQ
jgi:hypothetical protein